MSLKLYEIKNEYLKALDRLKYADDIPENIVGDIMYSINADLEEKVKNTAAYIKNLEHEVIAMKNYEENMNKRRSSLENKIESIKTYIKVNMLACDKTKIESPEFNVLIKRCAPVAVITDQSNIPEECYVTKIERVLDKKKLMEILELEEIQGVEVRENYSLTIK